MYNEEELRRITDFQIFEGNIQSLLKDEYNFGKVFKYEDESLELITIGLVFEPFDLVSQKHVEIEFLTGQNDHTKIRMHTNGSYQVQMDRTSGEVKRIQRIGLKSVYEYKKEEQLKKLRFALRTNFFSSFSFNTEGVSPIVIDLADYETKGFDYLHIEPLDNSYRFELILSKIVSFETAFALAKNLIDFIDFLSGERHDMPSHIECGNTEYNGSIYTSKSYNDILYQDLRVKESVINDVFRKFYLWSQSYKQNYFVVDQFFLSYESVKISIISFLNNCSCLETLGRELYETNEIKKDLKLKRKSLISAIMDEEIKEMYKDRLGYLDNLSFKNILVKIFNEASSIGLLPKNLSIKKFSKMITNTRNKYVHIENKRKSFKENEMGDLNHILRHIFRGIYLTNHIEFSMEELGMVGKYSDFFGPLQRIISGNEEYLIVKDQ